MTNISVNNLACKPVANREMFEEKKLFENLVRLFLLAWDN
jgi:hypothetical protein